MSKDELIAHNLTTQNLNNKLCDICQQIYEDSKNNSCHDDMITWFINLFLYINKIRRILYNNDLTHTLAKRKRGLNNSDIDVLDPVPDSSNSKDDDFI